MACTIRNPIIPGFSPDPSITFVGGIFFLVTSSFHIFPGLPVYASHDLQNWTHIGNAINRTSQVDLSNVSSSVSELDTGYAMVGTGGLFAPTIRHHQGLFYIVCTNVYDDPILGSQSRNFILSTEDIWSDKWSDPVYFDFNGIDPSLFFDENGKVYIQGCWSLGRKEQPTTTIKQFEICIKTGEALSPVREIWSGRLRYDTEGPHIYKKDGYYYLLISEGGTFENHTLSIARSSSIWGPFVMDQEHLSPLSKIHESYVQHVGHADLFEDTSERWWAVVLGVRKKRNESFPLGRETFLLRVTWEKDGWPRINGSDLNQDIMYHGSPTSTIDSSITSDFPTSDKVEVIPGLSAAHSRVDDVYLRAPCLSDYCIEHNDERSTSVTMQSSWLGSSSPVGAVSFWGKRQRSFNCTTTVVLPLAGYVGSRASSSSHTDTRTHLQAGLTLYKDHLRHAEVFIDHKIHAIRFEGCNEASKWRASAKVNIETLDANEKYPHVIKLTLTTTEESYVFTYQTLIEPDQKQWTEPVTLGTVGAPLMTNRDFTGPLIALYAHEGNEKAERMMVEFQDFKIEVGC